MKVTVMHTNEIVSVLQRAEKALTRAIEKSVARGDWDSINQQNEWLALRNDLGAMANLARQGANEKPGTVPDAPRKGDAPGKVLKRKQGKA